MKLLLLNTDLEIGGTPTVVRELARRLPEHGVETSVACLGRVGPVAEQIAGDGIDVTAFDVRPRQILRGVSRLRALVDELQVDAVLSFLVHANTVAAMASKKRPDVAWWQSIQTTQPNPRWHWRVQEWAAKKARGVIVPSRAIAEAATDRSHVPTGSLHVLPNGIDAETIVDQPATRLGERLQIGFVGRLDPVKNLGLLLAIAQARPDYDVHIFGDGPQRETIEFIVADRQLLNVRLHGFRPREGALAEIDLLVLPSHHEGFGLVLIEAMAAGVAVIGSGIPGIDEVIRHCETGRLVHSTDAYEWADAIDELNDDALRTRYAMEALQDVRERFTWQQIVPRYAKLLTHT
ncbi:MAG: glycosyltransferase family 4 protein [Planctomycetota bacterium]